MSCLIKIIHVNNEVLCLSTPLSESFYSTLRMGHDNDELPCYDNNELLWGGFDW